MGSYSLGRRRLAAPLGKATLQSQIGRHPNRRQRPSAAAPPTPLLRYGGKRPSRVGSLALAPGGPRQERLFTTTIRPAAA